VTAKRNWDLSDSSLSLELHWGDRASDVLHLRPSGVQSYHAISEAQRMAVRVLRASQLVSPEMFPLFLQKQSTKQDDIASPRPQGCSSAISAPCTVIPGTIKTARQAGGEAVRKSCKTAAYFILCPWM